MTLLIQKILMTQGFVFLKSWNDSIYIKNRKVVPTHLLEWFMVAWVSTTAGMGYSNTLLGVATFDFLMLPVTWILMDLELNIFLQGFLKAFSYVGSGWWDDFFKMHAPSNTARAIWISKIALLFVASWMFYEATR